LKIRLSKTAKILRVLRYAKFWAIIRPANPSYEDRSALQAGMARIGLRQIAHVQRLTPMLRYCPALTSARTEQYLAYPLRRISTHDRKQMLISVERKAYAGMA